MDPNPKSFPVLSYVLSRFHLGSGKKIHLEADIEQPFPRVDDGGEELELMERMPRLKRPELLAAMAQAIADVAGSRSVLRSLGNRPDHEAVDAARARISQIEADMAADLEALEFDGVESRTKAEKEKEKLAYCAVVQLEEMHAAYEELLKDAEERLVRIYNSAEKTVEIAAGESSEGANDEEETDEEVVRILQEADSSGRCVETVNLSGRGLRFLPETFGKLRDLLILDLSNNQLEIIPDSIAGLENLQELNLSSNLLTSLPDSIGLLINIKILNLSGNKLKSLPDSISRCRSLVELDASFNELAYLPTTIGLELLDLQKLSINLNKIRSLPTSICEMRSLRRIDARFNELRGLPHSIGKLTNLETLDLSNNFSDLISLPETFGDLINLRELDLSNNQISSLPDSFGKLESLIKLNLDGNPLLLPPSEIIDQGIEAVKEFMSKRWIQILMEEDQKTAMESASMHSSQAPGGWLTRSTSWLNSVVYGVSGYLVSGGHTARDPCLDEQL